MKYIIFMIVILCIAACRKPTSTPDASPIEVEVMVYATPAQDTSTVVASTQTIQLQVR